MKPLASTVALILQAGLSVAHRIQLTDLLGPHFGGPPDLYFNQTLDHFNALNNGWFNQRYWVNDTFWTGTGPLFLNLQGEWTASSSCATRGFSNQLAANYKALIICLEHRFYGESVPVSSFQTDNMATLSSHQAVADIASFLQWAYQTYPGITRTVSFGCSYAGALTTWARGTLPHLIHAAVASSAPVEVPPGGVHESFNTVVGTSLANPTVGGSAACLANTRLAFQALDAAMRGDVASQTAMSNKMYSCAPATSSRDVMWLATNVATVLQLGVQYAQRPQTATDPARNVSRLCSYMTAPGLAPIDALSALVQASLPLSSIAGWIPISVNNSAPFAPSTSGKCVDNSWGNFIAVVGNTTVDRQNPGMWRQWLYQCCTQYGFCSWGACRNSTTCPFSSLIHVEDNFLLCSDAFDARIAPPNNLPRLQWTNAQLGGYNTAAGRVLFVNGDIDPWSSISSTPGQDLNPSNPSIVIAGGSHCSDYGDAQPNEAPALAAAHAQINATIAEWLQQPRYGFPPSSGGGADNAKADGTMPIASASAGMAVLGVIAGASLAVLYYSRRGAGGAGGILGRSSGAQGFGSASPAALLPSTVTAKTAGYAAVATTSS